MSDLDFPDPLEREPERFLAVLRVADPAEQVVLWAEDRTVVLGRSTGTGRESGTSYDEEDLSVHDRLAAVPAQPLH